MTVQQLIRMLQNFRPDLDVKVEHYECGTHSNADVLEASMHLNYTNPERDFLLLHTDR